MIKVTDSAETYLAELLSKQKVKDMAVRIFVTQPGTSYAETCLAYCRPEEVVANDEIIEFQHFRLYVETVSLPYLEEALVDYAVDSMGGQLTIKAPNAKSPKISDFFNFL